MSKTIILGHGDKGGCGKSVITHLMAVEAEKRNLSTLIIEADAADKGQPDVGPRFEDSSADIEVLRVPLVKSGQTPTALVGDMFSLIQQSDAEVVIINTPAGASDILEEVASIIGMFCNQLKYSLRIVYSLFKTKAALTNAEELTSSPLFKDADQVLYVQNEYFGVPDLDKYPALKKADKVTIPALEETVMSMVEDDTNFNQAKEYLMTSNTFQQIILVDWLNKIADSGLYKILDQSKDAKTA